MLQEDKKFINEGFKKNPTAMIWTVLVAQFFLLASAIGTMFVQVVRSQNEALQREERNKRETVEILLKVFRPELLELKETVKEAKQNVDTVTHKLK